jgi:hypothetical protein
VCVCVSLDLFILLNKQETYLSTKSERGGVLMFALSAVMNCYFVYQSIFIKKYSHSCASGASCNVQIEKR